MVFNKFPIAVLPIILLVVISTWAFDKNECKGLDIKRTVDHLLNIKECQTDLSVKITEMSSEQWTCMLKCVLEKRLMGKDGKPHKENILQLADEIMPEDVKEDLSNRLGKCLDDFGSNINLLDHGCTSYEPLSKCIQETLDEICKP